MDKLPIEVIKTVEHPPFEVQLCNLDDEKLILFNSEDVEYTLALPPAKTLSEYYEIQSSGFSSPTTKNCPICNSTITYEVNVMSFEITAKNEQKYGESGLKTLCRNCTEELFEIRNTLIEDEFYSILSAEFI